MESNMDSIDEARGHTTDAIYWYMKQNHINELSDADIAALVKEPDEKGVKAYYLLREFITPIQDILYGTKESQDQIENLTIGEIKKRAEYEYELANIYIKYADNDTKRDEEAAKLRLKYQK